MFRTLAQRVGKVPATLIAVAALGGSLLASGPAGAAPAPPGARLPYGTVIALQGVNERAYPSLDSSSRGILKYRTQVGLRCKVHAQEVGRNGIWYLLRDRDTWVAAKWVGNTGEVPRCRGVNRSAADQSAESRNAMG
ncbi:SH3 domain-containing protein [Streptomyces orinoci]|uniref:SH3 domain-containing protein n=1 Tax=Streptomyces orinoci TaxID=67339 RepID=A0ABV3JWC1_STRON|nr:SH3 domain-containing protein [Streptomyces orinoci]